MGSAEEALLDELSRINSELVNARRELSRLNAELADKERFLARVLELSPDIVYVHDIRSRTDEYRNRAFEDLLGHGDRGRASLEELMHPDDAVRRPAHLAAVAALPDGAETHFEFRLRRGDGSWCWFLGREAPFLRDGSGAVIKTVGVAEDIGPLKERESRLLDASLTDVLTGLRNRRGFEAAAGEALRDARSRGAALVYVDLDRFKEINDRYGHAEGDTALKAAAALLVRNTRDGDLAARLGGDEFAILARGGDGEAAQRLAERFGALVDEWNLASGKPWKLCFSAGWAVAPRGGQTPLADLMARADEAMYAVKRGRRQASDGA
ncbi:MAG TPA: sensor domain-containing diguanylate cyclase [Spirochaetales bacterium]|nr:sensor domain-containing diguanylate cyclase [Spirochaetales bacterium]